MRPEQLVLRCYAEKLSEGAWAAYCLDLTLAAQGDSFEDARSRLESMIVSYLEDVLVEGAPDRAHAGLLLTRKAPLRYWAKYYIGFVRSKLGRLGEEAYRRFCEAYPVTLIHGH